MKRLICIGFCAAAVGSSAMAAGLVPVSRYSLFTSKGYYIDNSNYPYPPTVPPQYWDVNESTTSLGFFGASHGSGWHYSDASATGASLISYFLTTGHHGNYYSTQDVQSSDYKYVFDVTSETKVNVYGSGLKLSATNGFTYNFNGAGSANQPILLVLQMGRYTLEDTFTDPDYGFADGHLIVVPAPAGLAIGMIAGVWSVRRKRIA